MVQTEPVIKRMESHTVATSNSWCKLKTFSGGDYGLPSYIKERFANGFPPDWVQLRKKWILFLQSGKPQDFQWEENQVEVSAEDVYLAKIPSGQSSLENSCEGSADNTQERNFAFSPLIGKSKVSGIDVGHTSSDDTVGNHGRVNRGHLPDLQEKRDIYGIPECSDTDKTTKKCLLTTKESFIIATDDSENATDADIDIESRQTNCQVVKKNHDQYENMQKLPVTQRKNNTSQASQVPSPRVVLARVEPEPPSVASASSRQASPPARVTASVAEKQRQLPKGTEILLKDWLPILVENQLFFKGTRVIGKTKMEYTTSAVISRVDKDVVNLSDGTKCRLVGSLADKDNCLPANIRSKFRSGLPRYWRELLLQWIDYVNFEGETYSSVISHVASEKKWSNTPEEGPKGSLAMPASDESETVNKPKAWATKNVKSSVNAKRRKESLDLTAKKRHKKREPSVTSKIVNNTKQKKKLRDKTAKKRYKKQEPSVSEKVVNNTKQKKESLEKTAKKSHKKPEPSVPMKKFDMNMDFTDFAGKPPRTMKQRKKLDDVKTMWQKDKKNTDIFDDDSPDAVRNSNVVWDEFISPENVESFSIGELTPHSKMLNGSYLTTPVISPMSTSLFQKTPCKSDEILRYVHQQKTKDDKPNKKNNTRQKKTTFLASSVRNEAADDVYAALLSGDPIANLMNKEKSSDDSSFTQLSD